MRTTMAVLAAGASALLLLAPAAGASTKPPAERTTFVLHAENKDLLRIDRNQAGPDNTDLVHRVQTLSRKRGGPVIGDSYSQSEIVAIDTAKAVDVRHVEIQASLPDGWIFIRGMSILPIGTVPQPGWNATYAIVGGTGTYAGARGSQELTLLDDGVTFEVRYSFRR